MLRKMLMIVLGNTINSLFRIDVKENVDDRFRQHNFNINSLFSNGKDYMFICGRFFSELIPIRSRLLVVSKEL